ncbi:MAG: family 20 glycosylhydrolase [Oscillospiraceae bacterium]|nr:family 20 glycosylhydrolase [Oscillospiraceae bacterium]
MKIGLLNDYLNNIKLSFEFEGSSRKLEAVAEGNPFSGETLSISWQVARNSPVELSVKLEKKCFVDCVEIELGEETELQSLALKSDGDTYGVYTAETGKAIYEKVIRLEGGFLSDELSIILLGDFSDIEVRSIRLFGAMEENADVFPIPDKAEYGDEIIPVSVFSSYSAECEVGLLAGKVLAEKFLEITGEPLKPSESGSVCFVTDEGIAKDGFALEVNENGAKISASNFRGFVLGAESFIKLTGKNGVRKARVSDAPFMPFRGVHLMLPSVAEMDYAKRLIKYMISPLGYNAVIIELAGGMQYESHPEINEALIHTIEMSKKGEWPPFPHACAGGETIVPKAAVSEFVEYIRSFGIEVIPEVQSLSHVQFMTQAHPDIAEIEDDDEMRDIDTRGEDARPEKFYRHSYCPSNPKSYEILFDLLDEVIEVFKPTEYVHMGHDEVYEIGVCPICKHKDPAKLLADDINKIYAYLKDRGLKMMIWSDMIQPVTKYRTPSAIDMIPKDILMLDFIWYFHFDKDIEENLLEKGFKVAVGNLYSSHYPRYEKRIRKSGMVGGQISTWVGTNEPALQAEGKLYDIVLTAEMLWDEGYSKRHTLSYDNIIRALMPQLRENLQDVRYPSLIENAKREILLENPFDVEKQEKSLCINGEFDSIVFDHTELVRMVRLPWQKYDEVGSYILSYDDGSEEIVPITSCGNIGYCGRRQNKPLAPQLYRHSGYISTYLSDTVEERNEKGEKLCIYHFEHILPKGKKLKCIKLCENEKFDTKILLRRVTGVK